MDQASTPKWMNKENLDKGRGGMVNNFSPFVTLAQIPNSCYLSVTIKILINYNSVGIEYVLYSVKVLHVINRIKSVKIVFLVAVIFLYETELHRCRCTPSNNG